VSQVDNPYRVAIVARRSQAWASLGDLETVLSGPARRLRQAWVGGSSEQACRDVDSMKSDLVEACGGARDRFDDAIRDQPVLVDEDAWQVHWRNL